MEHKNICNTQQIKNKNKTQNKQSGTLPFSVALRELPYTVTLFDRATENGSSGH